MRDKWFKIEIFYKSILVSVVYSALILIISSILIILNTSWVFGTLIGIIALFASYLIIWIFWYKIPKTKHFLSKYTGFFVPLIRLAIYLIVFLTIMFTTNSEYNDFEMFLYPINTIILLIVYTIPMTSYLSIGLIDFLLKRRESE